MIGLYFGLSAGFIIRLIGLFSLAAALVVIFAIAKLLFLRSPRP